MSDLQIRGVAPDAKQADAKFSLSAGHTGLQNESENSSVCVADYVTPKKKTLSTCIDRLKTFSRKCPVFLEDDFSLDPEGIQPWQQWQADDLVVYPP